MTERRDKEILNIVSKAREKRALMLRVFFGNEPIPDSVDDPNINYLSAHGVVQNGVVQNGVVQNGVVQNIDGFVQVPVPLYSKRLITAFRPPLNGESSEYIDSIHETLNEFIKDNRLNIDALLDKYCAYVRRRGFHAFDTKQLKEGAWHYSLDGFIHFFIEQLGEDTWVEVPSGHGRTDILILYRQQRYIIETKVFVSDARFQNGKLQLVDYLKSEELEEGYYVVFSNKHTEADTLYTSEVIASKRIHTWIIRTNFEKASRYRKLETGD